MRSAASSTSPSASSRFLPTSRLISAASSLDRSLIRSAAARSTATRSGQGVRAHRRRRGRRRAHGVLDVGRRRRVHPAQRERQVAGAGHGEQRPAGPRLAADVPGDVRAEPARGQPQPRLVGGVQLLVVGRQGGVGYAKMRRHSSKSYCEGPETGRITSRLVPSAEARRSAPLPPPIIPNGGVVPRNAMPHSRRRPGVRQPFAMPPSPATRSWRLPRAQGPAWATGTGGSRAGRRRSPARRRSSAGRRSAR